MSRPTKEGLKAAISKFLDEWIDDVPGSMERLIKAKRAYQKFGSPVPSEPGPWYLASGQIGWVAQDNMTATYFVEGETQVTDKHTLTWATTLDGEPIGVPELERWIAVMNARDGNWVQISVERNEARADRNAAQAENRRLRESIRDIMVAMNGSNESRMRATRSRLDPLIQARKEECTHWLGHLAAILEEADDVGM